MKNNIPNLNFLARSSEIRSRVPFSEEQIGLLLGNLGEEFSDELPDIDRDKDCETYSLRNSESEISKQISLSLGKNNIQIMGTRNRRE